MFKFIENFYVLLIRAGTFLLSFLLLGMRLFWGWQFFSGGWEKFLNIASIISFFQALGIPFPTINAYIAASIECFGGLCLLLGLASRLVSIPLMIVMVVAMVTAHHDVFINIFSNPVAFTQQTPFNFFLTALIVFAFGPGIFSLDALIKRLFFKKKSF
ncbi:MAG: DoxX family protein [Parachlamydiaceae bacterium]|nr:DoxX family protein [Parachlamydiaceae bacterium]